MAAPDDRTLIQLGASIHGDLARLAEALEGIGGHAGSGLLPLMNNIVFLVEGLAARGLGDEPVGGDLGRESRGELQARDVIDLCRDLHTDLTKLNVRLHALGLPPAALGSGALADAPGQINDLVGKLLPYRDFLSSQAPDASRATPLNLQPLQGARPGERPNELDKAMRAFEGVLRATKPPK